MANYKNFYLLKSGRYISGGTTHTDKTRAEIHALRIMSNGLGQVLQLSESVKRSDIVSVTSEIDKDSIGV